MYAYMKTLKMALLGISQNLLPPGSLTGLNKHIIIEVTNKPTSDNI